MARSPAQIVSDLEAFRPIDGDWRPLDPLFFELWETGESGGHIRDLLAILERFPEDDGAGVLWTVLHGLEDLPGYEPELVRSVQRQPSELTIIMVGRLLNAGLTQVGDVSLLGLLQSVMSRPGVPSSLVATAASWVEG